MRDLTQVLLLQRVKREHLTFDVWNETLQSEQVESPTEFREQKRRKRNASDKQGSHTGNTVVTGCGASDSRIRPQAGLPTRNFFALLRTEMEETNDGEHQGTTSQASYHPNFCNEPITVAEKHQRHRQGQL
jgi:hypothetical protein